jgi:hypothetical protein
MRYKTWLVVGALFLITGGLHASAYAMSREGGFRGEGHAGMQSGGDHDDFHGGYHGGGFRGGVFAGPAFGNGWGSPWFWDPYFYPGPNVVEVHHANYGTIEFKVRPENTKVYVDKKFIGSVNDLDHHRAYMPIGNHDIKLVAPDGQTLDRTIYVAAGQKIKIQEKL